MKALIFLCVVTGAALVYLMSVASSNNELFAKNYQLLLYLGGGRGDNAGVMRRIGGVFVALAIIGLAVSGAGVNLGTWLANLFTG